MKLSSHRRQEIYEVIHERITMLRICLSTEERLSYKQDVRLFNCVTPLYKEILQILEQKVKR